MCILDIWVSRCATGMYKGLEDTVSCELVCVVETTRWLARKAADAKDWPLYCGENQW
jgi:hypothetical protein